MVLPVAGTEPDLAGVVGSYRAVLGDLDLAGEIILVPDPDADCVTACRRLAAGNVRVSEPRRGWGSAVRAGLRDSDAETLCYANWRRTSAAVLAEMLGYALRNHNVVVRANRRTRDSAAARLGSLIFNLECRALLHVVAWDVNGTPKVFTRRQAKLLELTRDDGLLDAEFALVCQQQGYPVIEIPIDSVAPAEAGGGPSTLEALRMYVGVIGLARGARRRR